MQKKEIVHAYSVANTKRGIFLTKKSVYVTLKGLHHGSCLTVTGLSPSRLGFNPKPVHMGIVVDKAALTERFCPLSQITLVSTSLSFHQLLINP